LWPLHHAAYARFVRRHGTIMKRAILAMMTVAACGGVHQSQSSAALTPRKRLDLRAGVRNAIRYNYEDPGLLSALFRQLLQLADTGSADLAAYCLAVGSKEIADSESDASPEVLERLRDLPLPVRPRTDCRFHSRQRPFVDKNTKGKAMVLRVVGLYTNDSTSIMTAVMDYYIGPLWAAGWGCLVSKDQEEWRVSRCERMWVS